MRVVFLGTLVLYTLNLFARFAHFQMWSLPSWLDRAIDVLLTANVQIVLIEDFFAPYVVVLCGLVFLLSLHVRFFARPFFKYTFYVLLTLGLLPLNSWVDGSPENFAIYLLILLLLCPLPIRDPRRRMAARFVILVLFVAQQVARTAQLGDLPYVVLAALIGGSIIAGQQRGWSSAGLFFAGNAALMLHTIVLSMVPQSVLEDRLVAEGRITLSSSGQAYSFCYAPETQYLFSAVNPDRVSGDWSHLERIDLSGADEPFPITRIQVFDDSDPKLRQIDCDDGKVYFSDKRDNGRRGVGVVSGTDGAILTRSLFEQEAGNTFVHVAERNRMFFFPEAGDSFVEFDTTNQHHTLHPFDVSAQPLVSFLPLPITPFLTNLQAYSLERNAIYVNHFLSGSDISEIDFNTGQVRRKLRTYNGLNHSLTVDRRYDRLIVSGLWGVEFVDLDSGKVVDRQRTEFDARAAVVDERNDLIYVPTRFGRYLYVFDRASMRLLGKLLVGSGARNIVLTDSELILSSRTGVYALKRDDLRQWAADRRNGQHL